MVVPDVEAAAAGLRQVAGFVSSRVVTIQDRALGFTKGLLVRDPDGHVVQLVAK